MQLDRIFLGRLWFRNGCFSNDYDDDDDITYSVYITRLRCKEISIGELKKNFEAVLEFTPR
jgi:hypothetical protein